MAGQPKSASVSDSRAELLERLLFRDGAMLRRTAQANSANAADADDALQDGCVAFLRFYEGGEEGAIAWLRIVVKRCAWAIGKNARRRGSHRHVVTVEHDELAELEVILADSRSGTAELAERAEALERRIELLGQLKSDERTTLILIGLGASYGEIAALRGWSPTKINRCASEGRARLRQLEAQGGEKT